MLPPQIHTGNNVINSNQIKKEQLVLFLFFSGKFQSVRKAASLWIDSRKWNKKKGICVIIGENAVHEKIVIRAVFYLLWLVAIQKKRYTYIQKKTKEATGNGTVFEQ